MRLRYPEPAPGGPPKREAGILSALPESVPRLFRRNAMLHPPRGYPADSPAVQSGPVFIANCLLVSDYCVLPGSRSPRPGPSFIMSPSPCSLVVCSPLSTCTPPTPSDHISATQGKPEVRLDRFWRHRCAEAPTSLIICRLPRAKDSLCVHCKRIDFLCCSPNPFLVSLGRNPYISRLSRPRRTLRCQ